MIVFNYIDKNLTNNRKLEHSEYQTYHDDHSIAYIIQYKAPHTILVPKKHETMKQTISTVIV